MQEGVAPTIWGQGIGCACPNSSTSLCCCQYTVFLICHKQDWNTSNLEYPRGDIEPRRPPLAPKHYCMYHILEVFWLSDPQFIMLQTNGMPLVVSWAPGDIYTVSEILKNVYDHPINGFSHTSLQTPTKPGFKGHLH